MTHQENKVVAVACVLLGVIVTTAACAALGRSFPGYAQRPLDENQVIALRSLALALWAGGQALIVGAALPRLFRPRHFYRAAGWSLGVVGGLAASGSAALMLAR